MLNQAQRIVAESYGDGDYAHVQSLDECRDAGDTLFTFLMIELADSEDCTTLDEAIRRVEMARQQLDDLLKNLEIAEA